MLEERSPLHDSGEPSESPVGHSYQAPASVGLKAAVVVAILVAGFAIGYGLMQHSAAQQLASQQKDMTASLTQAKSEVDALTARVNDLSVHAEEEAARAQQAEAAKADATKNEQIAATSSATPHHRTHRRVANGAGAPDDPRWAKVQQQLGDQEKALTDNQKQIAETQANLDQAKAELNGNLESAKTDLGNGIARNHDEVVALEKKGERNYYEFSFDKSGTYHHTGPISIALRKADSKHGYCDLQLIVDDKSMTRKHINLYESVSLHPEGYVQPLEIVINRIDKDTIKGYVSEPKYRATEHAASAAATTPAAPATASAPTASAAVTLPTPANPGTDLEHRPASAQ
jgi:hypothetical protein